ncbi:hypothetical protein FKP32DRAFT_1559187 [Trametes sanguinea]|nr:hypothetical protein FKP32DRAFT_1559187 [Trametes sanguinea]
MRFCEGCKHWFHIQCLEVSNEAVPALLAAGPDRPPQPEDEIDAEDRFRHGELDFDGHDFAVWTTLLHLPIQRGYPDYLSLLSFELLLEAVRDHDRVFGCPSDVQDFIAQHIAMAPSLVNLTDKYCSVIQTATPAIFYNCPVCDHAI